ncbi:hypothetical protein HOG48_02185 [Candidatus Peregrinibacteria bacterium]|jgi:hypothetical protein|nr:hypothetical protein [Candidatus Peregrinibacteria bacterium]
MTHLTNVEALLANLSEIDQDFAENAELDRFLTVRDSIGDCDRLRAEDNCIPTDVADKVIQSTRRLLESQRRPVRALLKYLRLKYIGKRASAADVGNKLALIGEIRNCTPCPNDDCAKRI